MFTGLPELDWFSENGMGPDENGELLLQREIQPDGKNVCRLNGRLITVSQLRQLGRQLLNIHGQHDGQQLLDERCHLDYLDGFGGTGTQLEAFRAAYGSLSALRHELGALQMDEAEKARRIDTLQFQIGELERAELQAGEEEALLQRRDLLRSAGKLMDAVEGACLALSGDEERSGAAALLAEGGGRPAPRRPPQRRGPDPAGAAHRAALRGGGPGGGAAGPAGELRLPARGAGSSGEPAGRPPPAEKEVRRIGGGDAGTTWSAAGRNWTTSSLPATGRPGWSGSWPPPWRRPAGAARPSGPPGRRPPPPLEARIQEELAQLDMPKVRFRVEFAPKPGEWAMDETGMDQVQFLMSANVGEDLKPIQKIASGGELARIMLALKNVLAENDQVGTMVFDEVDTGVSGRAAQKVA